MRTKTKRFWVKEAIRYYLLNEVDDTIINHGITRIEYIEYDDCQARIYVNSRHPHYKYLLEMCTYMYGECIVNDLAIIGIHTEHLARISEHNPYECKDYGTAVFTSDSSRTPEYIELRIDMPGMHLEELKSNIRAAYANTDIVIDISDIDSYIDRHMDEFCPELNGDE